MAIRYLSGINVDSNTLFVDSANDRVGIGTATPAEKLHVAGLVRIVNSTFAGIEYHNTNGTWETYIGTENGGAGTRYNSASSQHTFYNNGSAVVRINSSGNVGIGTTAPGSKLHVWNGGVQVTGFPSSGNPFTFLQSDYNDAAVTVRFLNVNPSNGLDADLGIQLSNTSNVITDVMRIKGSTGNVGIGTTSPDAKLVIVGSGTGVAKIGDAGFGSGNYTGISLNGTLSTSNYNILSSPTDSTLYINRPTGATIQFRENNTTQVIIAASGNVGIGTTAPTATLTIGTNEDIQSTIGIGLGVNQSSLEFVHATFQNGFGSKFYSVDSGNGVTSLRLAVRANSTTWSDAMTIIAGTSGGGNIGIGTTSPSYTLDVAGQSRFGSGAKAIVGTDGTYGGYSTIGFGGTTNGYNRVFGYDGTGDGLYLTAATGQGMAFWTNGSSLRMFITAAGNVLIGTQVDYSRLTISNGASTRSGITISDANTASLMMFAGASAPASISFDTFGLRFVGGSTAGTDNGSEFMRITTAGNVGIGTTSPNTKLRIVDSTTNPPLSIQNTNADGYSGSWLYDSAGTLVGHWGWANGTTTALSDKMYFGTIANKPVVFTTNDSEKVRITAAGNVGIGTSAPGALLDVGGGDGTPTATQFTAVVRGTSTRTMYFDGGGSSGASVWWGDGNTPQFAIDSISGGGAAMWVHASSAWYRIIDVAANGNVGINQTAPTQKLDVFGNISLGSWTKSGNTYVGLRRADDGTFGNGGDSGLVIESYNHAAPYNGNYSQKVHLRTHLYNGGSHDVITGYGLNVGIGTSAPGFKLTVVAASATDSDILLAGMTGVSNGFTVRRVSSSFVYSMIDGGLGINNAAPTQALHVTGNARVTGAYYDSNNEAGTSGQVLSSTGSGTDWVTPATTTATSLYDLLPAARVAYNWTGQVVNDTWTTIFSKSDNILTTGTWMVQMYISDFAVGGGHYTYTYTGVMQWYQDTVNQTGEAAFSEIYLHRMGHAANASVLYLRTAESGAAAGNLGYFQIKGNYSNTSNTTINFKFVKIF